ncbi:MAG: hypothetical protein ABW252_05280 [Polyangiales bacterium]
MARPVDSEKPLPQAASGVGRGVVTIAPASASASTGIAVLSCSDGLAIGELDGVCIVVWRGEVTLERFRRQRAALLGMFARHPEGVGLLCVIERNVAPPDEYFRRASAEMIDSFGSRLCGVLCVIEDEGFRGSVTRSVLSGMALLLRSRAPARKFSSSVASGSTWLVGQCPATTARRLLLATHELKLRLTESMSPVRS